jgi:predicted nucleotidyltransferase
MSVQIPVDRDQISAFCRKHHIQKFSFFGSVLRNDFRPESNVDVLVEFEPDHVPGFIRLAGIERELSELLGRKADLPTEGCLSPYFKDEVLQEAEVQYVAA